MEGGFYYRNPHTRSGVFAAGVVDTATGDSLSLPSFKMANGQVVLDEMGVPVVEMDKEMMPMMETFSTIGAIGLAGAAEGDSADVARIKNAIKTARETQLMTAGANNTAIQSDNLRDTVRIADLHYHNTGMAGDGCGVIRIENNGVANPDDIQRVADDANCESFISRFPGGFVPRFGGVMNDRSFALGLRGELGGWFTDLSGVWGRHEADFFMHHTLNPQLLATDRYTVETIPTSYDPGAYTEIDYTINLDFARAFDVAAFTGPMNVAFGFEYRQEEFEVSVGGENSWYQDVCPGKGHAERCDYRDHLPEGVDPEKATDDQMKMAQAAADARAAQSLSAQGFGVGSNGFTGFGPRLGGKWSRESYATYADVEAEINSIFTAGIAVRYEDHDDAGDTADFKLSGRAQINDIVAVRSAVSTGFRAPTVGQANILNVTTAFTSGMLQDEATLPPTHPASALVGGEALTPEESTGFSLGTVLALGPVDVTADYYYIEVTDRIARSSDKTLTDEDRMTLEAQGVPDAVSFSQVRFYTNDFDTVTQGLDVVATMPVDMLDGVTDLSLAANWTDTSVEERNPDVIDDKRVKQLEENQPNYRWTFTANHANGPWNFLARVRYYGSYFEFTTDDASAPLDADDNFLVDLEASYTFGSSDIVVVLGAENVFDEYPSEVLGGNVAGLRYSDTSPYGFNGGYYYLRTLWNF